MGDWNQGAYHGLVGERLDLLDGAGGALLEGHAVQLLEDKNSSAFIIACIQLTSAPQAPEMLVLGRRRTLLCMWMVYSRATTSAMAERPCLPVFLVVDDISAD